MLGFFADACFLTALVDARDQCHAEANQLYSDLVNATFITGYENFLVSDWILVEMMHNLLNRVPLDRILSEYHKLRDECREVVKITAQIQEDAIENELKVLYNERHESSRIGIVDATSITVMRRKGINRIITNDRGFDNIPAISAIWTIDDARRILTP